MSNLAAYLRVSTHEQVANGHGLDAQSAAIRAWAKANRHKLVGTFTDAGLSGDLDVAERPALTDALALIDSGEADGIIVFALDRVARTLTTQEAILAKVWAGRNRHVFTVNGEVLRDDPDDPMRKAMRQMAGVFAELEKAQLLRRMRHGRAAKAAKGGFAYGSPPFGWVAKDRRLVKEPTEQRVIVRIVELRDAGHTCRSIAATLNVEGCVTKRGRCWTPGSVSDVLTRCRQAVSDEASQAR